MSSEIEKRLEALERAVEDLREDLGDFERQQVKLGIGLDLTRKELGLAMIPDDTGTGEVLGYDPAALLGMAPSTPGAPK